MLFLSKDGRKKMIYLDLNKRVKPSCCTNSRQYKYNIYFLLRRDECESSQTSGLSKGRYAFFFFFLSLQYVSNSLKAQCVKHCSA